MGWCLLSTALLLRLAPPALGMGLGPNPFRPATEIRSRPRPAYPTQPFTAPPVSPLTRRR